MAPRLISLTEATRILKLDRRTVLHWAERKRLRLRRDHRGWHFFSADEVKELAAELTRQAKAGPARH